MITIKCRHKQIGIAALTLLFAQVVFSAPDNCDISASVVFCSGNHSAGISISYPGDNGYSNLDVRSLTQSIAPTSGNIGVFYRDTETVRSTVDLGQFNLNVMDNIGIFIDARTALASSNGDISATLGGILVNGADNASAAHWGDITAANGTGIRANAINLSSSINFIGGTLIAGNDGLAARSTFGEAIASAQGTITAGDSAISVIGATGASVTNAANLDVLQTGVGINVIAEGYINIRNSGSISVPNGRGIFAESQSGDVSIIRPFSSGFPVLSEIASSGDAIHATTSGNIRVEHFGDLTTLDFAGVYAASSEGMVDVDVLGNITAISTSAGNGIDVHAKQDIDIRMEGEPYFNTGQISTPGGRGITAASTDGNIKITASLAEITSGREGINAEANQGSIQVYAARIATAGGHGIRAVGQNEVEINQFGDIDTLSGGAGIFATSSGSSLDINSYANITTFGNAFAPGMLLNAVADIDILQFGDVSAFNSDGIFASSSEGNINIELTGDISASGVGRGIFAQASSGNILMNTTAATLGFGTNGNDASTIEVTASGSINMTHSGDLFTDGMRSHGVSVNAGSGAALVIDGNVQPAGSEADGINITSGSNITVTVTRGTVESGIAEGDSAVRFTNGDMNTLTNYGTLLGLSGTSVVAGDGNDKIENQGYIDGDISLGGGLNSVVNAAGAQLSVNAILNIGENNHFTNEGEFLLGDESISAVAMVGNFNHTSTGELMLDIGDLLNHDTLNVDGDVMLSGLLDIRLSQNYQALAGDFFDLIFASQITLASETLFYDLAGTIFSLSIIEGASQDILRLSSNPSPVPLPPGLALLIAPLTLMFRNKEHR